MKTKMFNSQILNRNRSEAEKRPAWCRPLPRNNSERGVAALEFAISSVVLVLFLFGTLDVSNSLLAYTYLTSNVREAARTASRIAQLEVKDDGTAYVDLYKTASSDDRDGCEAGTSAGYPCGQLMIQQRLRYLTQLHSLDNYMTDIQLESQYFKTGNGTRNDAVRIRASGTFNGYLFHNLRISTEIISPYLYNQVG